MFGLESGKKKEPEFVFDLEKEVQGVERYQEIVETVQRRTGKIKTLLREGTTKEQYDLLVAILTGYVALLKVLSRVISKR